LQNKLYESSIRIFESNLLLELLIEFDFAQSG